MESDNQSTDKTKVGFPDAKEPQKSGSKKVIFIIVVIIIILAGGAWYLLSRKEETIEFTNDSITPFISESTPTPIEEEVVEKDTLKVNILNGTGTPGDAGKLETALNELGYSEIEAGNADNFDYTSAEVTFSSTFPENYKAEIMEKLAKMYSEVKDGSETLGSYDVVIVTGTSGSSTTTKATATVTPTEADETTTPTP